MTTPTPSPATDLQALVAQSADAADLFATAPALLLELTEAVGGLAAAAGRLTERGRRPFRPDEQWERALGQVAYCAYLLADQSGSALDGAVRAIADDVQRSSAQQAAARSAADDDAWPLRD